MEKDGNIIKITEKKKINRKDIAQLVLLIFYTIITIVFIVLKGYEEQVYLALYFFGAINLILIVNILK